MNVCSPTSPCPFLAGLPSQTLNRRCRRYLPFPPQDSLRLDTRVFVAGHCTVCALSKLRKRGKARRLDSSAAPSGILGAWHWLHHWLPASYDYVVVCAVYDGSLGATILSGNKPVEGDVNGCMHWKYLYARVLVLIATASEERSAISGVLWFLRCLLGCTSARAAENWCFRRRVQHTFLR